MLYTIQIVFFDIKKQWLKMLFILIQLLVAMSLCCYIFQQFDDYKMFQKQMTKLTQNNNMYILKDKTEEFRFNQMVNEDKLVYNLQELNNYIVNDLNVTKYIADPSCSLSIDNSYQVPVNSINSKESKFNQIKTLRISKDFITVFNLEGDFDFQSTAKAFAEYKESNTQIPILLGYNFKKYYNKGDLINDKKNREYKVYGFFKNSSYYIAPDRIKDMDYLDNYIVMPSCLTNSTDGLTAAFQFLSTYYITDNKAKMYKIIDKSNDLHLFSLNLRSFKEQCKNVLNDILENILFNSSLFTLLLCFSLIGFIGNIIQFISDTTREFAVLLLCGSTEAQIVLRIGLQIGFMIILSNIAPLLLFGLCKAYFMTLCFSLLIGFLILLYPIVKINLQSIIIMIRRNAE